MSDDPAGREHRVRTRLTTIKLVLELLDRSPELSARQRRRVRLAIEAIDALRAELLARGRATREA